MHVGPEQRSKIQIFSGPLEKRPSACEPSLQPIFVAAFVGKDKQGMLQPHAEHLIEAQGQTVRLKCEISVKRGSVLSIKAYK